MQALRALQLAFYHEPVFLVAGLWFCGALEHRYICRYSRYNFSLYHLVSNADASWQFTTWAKASLRTREYL